MILTTYHNFDLLLTRAGARYKAIVVDAPAGDESVLFDLPFAADALPRLEGLARGAADDMDATRHIGAADDQDTTRHIGAADDVDATASLADLGSQLFSAIFGGQVGNLWAASLASVAGEGAGLRLRLRFEADAAELALLPWETLYDPAQGHFVGLGEASPVLRYLALPRSRSALPVKPPLRVLAVLASPDGLPALDMEREWRTIQNALAGLVADGKFVLERLTSPTLDAMQQRLLGESVHILHFIGHGVFDEASQAGCLAFADARNRPHLVRGDDLAKLLRNHPAVRLAYLNACEGALASGQSVFTGVAQALVREGVPAAVAMQAEISDPGAVELARTFYTALASGRPVDAALTQARVALSAAGSGEWAIPVLFSRSPDNRLFDIRQVLPTPDCPYPGMVPFSEAQRDLFFGRNREIEDAVARLRQHPFLAVIGPSGSGKSSLIYAGVIPALRKSRRAGAGEWDIKTMRPGDRRSADGKAAPRQALAELLGLTPQSPNLPLPPSPHLPTPTLLFVDQFEEVFTLAATDEAQAFLAALQGLIGRPNLAILLTARADFYPELMACALWPPIKANRLELPPLGDDGLWAAIVEPAGRVGVIVDEALAVRLIADASGQKGVLPLVQETLVLLWGRVKDRQLRLKDYQALADGGRSGLQVAIDRRASLVYDNLPETAQPLARRIFLRLVQFGEGRADTRRQQNEADLRARGDDPALFDATLATLITSRLLTATGEAGSADRRVDIAHEALIAGWPRLKEWLAQRRAAEGTRRRLEGKAAEWMAAQKRGGLLDEYELQEAEHWLAGEDAGELGVSQALLDLVAASKKAVAQAKTKEVEAERSRKRSRLFAGGLALAMLVIALVGYFALTAQTERNKALSAATAEARARETSDANAREANTQKAAAETAQAQAVDARATAEAAAIGEAVQRAKAEAARVALSAVDQLDVDKERALLLAVYAARHDASMFTDGALRRALASPGHTVWFTATLPAEPVWSHSGRELLIRTAKNDVYIRDMETGTQNFVSSVQNASLGRMAWSPDDMYFVIEAGTDVQVWSTAKRQPVASAKGQLAGKESHWSPDGSRILLRDEQGLYIWHWNDDQTTAIDAGDWVDTAWSADGNYLSTLLEGALQIWDSTDGTQRELGSELILAGGAFWSPKDSRLLIIGPDGRLRIWNAVDVTTVELTTPIEPLPTPNPDPPIIVDGAVNLDPADWRNHVAWSPDGTRILTFKDRVQVWDASEGSKLADLTDKPSDGSKFHSIRAYWSPDGQRVLIDDDLKASIFYLDGSGNILKLSGVRSANVNSFYGISQPWSPDGTKILSQEHNKLTVWDATTGAQIAFLTSEAGIDITHAEWSPTGEYVLGKNDLADETSNVRVWSLEPVMKPIWIEGYSFEPWSADGAYLITRIDDTVFKVWRANTGREATTLSVYGFGGLAGRKGWSPDKQHLIVYRERNMPRVWDSRDWRSYVDLRGHKHLVTATAWSPRADRVATGSEDGTMRIWDPNTGETIRVLEGHNKTVNDIDWSPDGAYIASAGADKTIRIWRADTGELVHMLKGHSGPVRSVSWNPQAGSPLLLSQRAGGDKNDTARVWNIQTGEQVEALVGGDSNIHTAEWNNKLGTHIAAVTDKYGVYLWQQGDFRQLDGVSTPIAWSPDGIYLAGARADATIVVWDVRAGSVFKEYVGHTGDVNSIDWSPADAKSFVSHGDDGQIRLWNLESTTAAVVIDTGDNSASGASFSPAGTQIAFWGSGEGMQVYPTRLDDLITIACKAAVRNLGPLDWHEFIPSQEPEVICVDRPIPGKDYPDPRANTGKG